MSFIIIFIICAALFFAVMLNLTFKGTFRKRIMGFGCVIAIVLGLFSYSYGYAMAFGVSASVAIRVLLSTCRMFGGVNDFSTVAGTPLFQHEAMRTLFWLGHFLAFYITASAAIEVLGHRLIRRIRARMARRGNLCVIYGDTDEALELARQQKESVTSRSTATARSVLCRNGIP